VRTIVICGDDAATRLVARGSFAGQRAYVVDVSSCDLPQVLVAVRVHVLVVLCDGGQAPYTPVVNTNVLHVRARDAHRTSTLVDAAAG
jgi:hypothetical protein